MTKASRPACSVALGPLNAFKSRKWSARDEAVVASLFRVSWFCVHFARRRNASQAEKQKEKGLLAASSCCLDIEAMLGLIENMPNQDGQVGNLFTREPNKGVTASAWAPTSASQVAGAER